MTHLHKHRLKDIHIHRLNQLPLGILPMEIRHFVNVHHGQYLELSWTGIDHQRELIIHDKLLVLAL